MTIFDFVRQKISIYDVVAKRVSLRRLGAYWKGSCPFHIETDASFTISPDKGIFYCFGCHESGDAVAFVAKLENASQFEAVQILVTENGLEIPPALLADKQFMAATNDGLDLAKKACKVFAQWAHEQLLNTPSILNYFAKRGINAHSIERFCLGYAPFPEAENIEKLLAFAQRQGILAQNLIAAGVLGQQQQGLWAPFVGRIIFPIRHLDGKTIAFGGRIIEADDTRPKYYNSKESELFHKGSVLFGLDLAKHEVRRSFEGFLVEGYMDCVAMSQHGFLGTFATLGTACTLAHMKLISRYLKTLYVVYDADRAGQQAVLKLAKISWDVEIELKVIVLPAGQDPASFLQQGGDLIPLKEAAVGIFEFFLQKNAEKFVGKPLSEKIEIVREVIKTIWQLQDVMKRDLLMLEVARVFQIPLMSLKKQLAMNRAPTANVANFQDNDLVVPVVIKKIHDNALSLSQQIFFMFLVAAKAGNTDFILSDNIAHLWEQEVNDWYLFWLETANCVSIDERFHLFIGKLLPEHQAIILKGMLLCEQVLDKKVFVHLQKELEKRKFKKLILDARHAVANSVFESDVTVKALQQISRLSKRVKSKE